MWGEGAGLQRTTLFLITPVPFGGVLRVLLSALWEELRWDRLSRRHRVSEHLIREAMKAPTTPHCEAALHLPDLIRRRYF